MMVVELTPAPLGDEERGSLRSGGLTSLMHDLETSFLSPPSISTPTSPATASHPTPASTSSAQFLDPRPSNFICSETYSARSFPASSPPSSTFLPEAENRPRATDTPSCSRYPISFSAAKAFCRVKLLERLRNFASPEVSDKLNLRWHFEHFERECSSWHALLPYVRCLQLTLRIAHPTLHDLPKLALALERIRQENLADQRFSVPAFSEKRSQSDAGACTTNAPILLSPAQSALEPLSPGNDLHPPLCPRFEPLPVPPANASLPQRQPAVPAAAPPISPSRDVGIFPSTSGVGFLAHADGKVDVLPPLAAAIVLLARTLEVPVGEMRSLLDYSIRRQQRQEWKQSLAPPPSSEGVTKIWEGRQPPLLRQSSTSKPSDRGGVVVSPESLSELLSRTLAGDATAQSDPACHRVLPDFSGDEEERGGGSDDSQSSPCLDPFSDGPSGEGGLLSSALQNRLMMRGVSFDRSKRNWEASWLDVRTGRRVKKCFSEGRWGASARDMAVHARREAEERGVISTRIPQGSDFTSLLYDKIPNPSSPPLRSSSPELISQEASAPFSVDSTAPFPDQLPLPKTPFQTISAIATGTPVRQRPRDSPTSVFTPTLSATASDRVKRRAGECTTSAEAARAAVSSSRAPWEAELVAKFQHLTKKIESDPVEPQSPTETETTTTTTTTTASDAEAFSSDRPSTKRQRLERHSPPQG